MSKCYSDNNNKQILLSNNFRHYLNVLKILYPIEYNIFIHYVYNNKNLSLNHKVHEIKFLLYYLKNNKKPYNN